MRLTGFDVVIVLAYLAGVTLLGITFRHGQRSVHDYFLAGRTAPWWALALSIVATETSTLTIIGTPALAFAGNMTFLQLVLGFLAGRVIIVLLFLPRYLKGEFYTAYQLIEKRFGARVKAAAASTFLVTRALAEGVRIAAIALVVTAAFGTGQRTSVIAIMALVIVYTFEGGMKAVIWTDFVQVLLYLAGSLAACVVLLNQIPGGWQGVADAAASGDKFRVFDFAFSLTDAARTYTFWSGLIGGAFFTMASHGTDQTIVQRLLAARSERESKLALLASGAVILFQFVLFLLVGVMLYAWRGAPVLTPGQSYDSVFPEFVVTAMPSGLRGLVIASIFAVAMSNASGSLNSLAASSVFDFHQLRGASTPDAGDPARLVRRSRAWTVVWGVVLVLLGTVRWGPLLEAGLTIASITFGSLLGLFLLAFLVRRATAFGVITGMLVGLAAMLAIHRYTPLVWTWYVLTGTAVTFMAGTLASLAVGPAGSRRRATGEQG